MRVPAEVMVRTGELRGELTLVTRSLFIEHGDRKVLIDPGIGPVITEEQQEAYGITFPETPDYLTEKLHLLPEEISDVIITHLHFDHVAGALKEENGSMLKRYPNARYYLPKVHTRYSSKPDPAEADALLWEWTRNTRVLWTEDWKESWLRFTYVNGHTPGMAVPVISCPGFDLVYGTDLIPMGIFTGKNISSGYDLDPLMAMEEKNRFLKNLKKPVLIALFHDPDHSVQQWPDNSIDPEKISRVLKTAN